MRPQMGSWIRNSRIAFELLVLRAVAEGLLATFLVPEEIKGTVTRVDGRLQRI